MRARFSIAMSCLLLVGLLFAASAAAEVRSGSATDGTEPERLPPGVDIVAASASYDTGGSAQVAVTTAAPPPTTSEEFLLGVVFGVLDGAECVEPKLVIAGTFFQPPYVIWQTNAGAKGPGTESISGSTTTLAATAPDFAGQPYNCVEPVIDRDAGGGEPEFVEGLAAPIQLVAPPPPPSSPPPSSPPPSSPPASSPPPAPAPAPAPKVASLSFPSQTVLLHRNAWKKVKVKVINTGTIAAVKPVLKIGKAKGVVIKPKSGKLKLKTIAPGKTRVASFSVALTRKAKPLSQLGLHLSAKGAATDGTLSLEIPRKAKKKQGKKEEEAAAPPPLAEKIFYSYESQASESAKLIGYAFLDDEWAYHGIPTEGLPGCTSETGSADAEGCVKYKFDPKTNAVQIGSLAGTISSSGQLEVNGETYAATSIPAAGERLQVEQEYIGYRGLCGLITGCTTFHEHLQLTSSGEFVLSHESLATAGGSGPGETFVAAGSYPADEHGTYAVEKGARIKLSFADGSTQTKTFAIFLNDAGQPDAAFTGLLLGNEYFTFAHAD